MKKRIIDITGEKFGKLKVLKYLGINERHRALWLCECECGNKKVYEIQDLRRNKSCGCERYRTDSLRIASKTNQKMAMEMYLKKYIIEDTNICVIKNEKLLSNNKSGTKGVSWDGSRQKWVAQINFKNKHYYLGRFTEREDAINARKEAEERLHKQFLRDKGFLED